MGRCGQIVMGPAGSGKSTYCARLAEHMQAIGRSVQVVNLDPAADNFNYDVSVDVRELIGLEDVMEEMELGPNGGLIFCMEYLIDNIDWLIDELEQLGNEAYVIFDCPGQIELFSHVPVMRTLVNELQRMDFAIAAVYLLDSQFMVDPSKYMSGVLTCLSCMMALELPHINVLSKLDLLASKSAVERYLDPPIDELVAELCADPSFDPKRARLTDAIGTVINDFGMVNFMGLDPTDEHSIDLILMAIDHAIQYHDDVEPREPHDDRDPEDAQDDDGQDSGGQFEGLGSVHEEG
ncbi:GPN-loop GTPase [Pavlovales sp. CCMP2436]|nr:GPN-loop GTPase [Pavlovales sp. CCMP2436]|mmetsp:Transcript_28456/g.71647  ORF Transcript_28456/g.71647 Transcript_28456/m.71647 type:complete len:293 (+) Transcript_28456:154-1032(+)